MIYINKEALNFFAHKINGKKDNDLLFTNDLITDLRVSSAILSLFNAIEDEKILEHKLKTLIGLLITKDFTKNQIIVNNESFNAINDSIAYARLNFSEKIDIGKMSNESKLSKYQFIRYFKKMTGITPASYILVHLINFAKSLLNKGLPIGEIALEAGFYDHAQFCKFFKYYTNSTPTEYKLNCNIVQA